MCFSVPVKIISIQGDFALLEGGRSVRLGGESKAKAGDYARLTGDIVAEILPRAEGEKILKLIADLNTPL